MENLAEVHEFAHCVSSTDQGHRASAKGVDGFVEQDLSAVDEDHVLDEVRELVDEV